MKNSFSFDRIVLLSKLHLATNRRMLTRMGSLTAGIIMLYYLLPFMATLLLTGEVNINAAHCAQSSLYILGIVFIVGTSMSMGPYFKRGSASSALMLPAKNAEKFLFIFVRTLIVNVVLLIAISIIINLLWSLALGQSIDLSVWFSFTFEGWGREIAMLCFVHSLFLFGATIFRRNAFVYTTLFLLAIFFILGVGITITTIAVKNGTFIREELDAIEPFFRYITYALTLGLWYFSWRRFTRISIAK